MSRNEFMSSENNRAGVTSREGRVSRNRKRYNMSEAKVLSRPARDVVSRNM